MSDRISPYIIGNSQKPSFSDSFYSAISQTSQKYPWISSIACGALSALFASPICGYRAAAVVGACVTWVAKTAFSKISTLLSSHSEKSLLYIVHEIIKGNLKIDDQITTIKAHALKILDPQQLSGALYERFADKSSVGSHCMFRCSNIPYSTTKESKRDAVLWSLANTFYEKKQYQNAFVMLNEVSDKRPYYNARYDISPYSYENDFNFALRSELTFEVENIVELNGDPLSEVPNISRLMKYASEVIDPVRFYKDCAERVGAKMSKQDRTKDEATISSFAKKSLINANLFACAKIFFHKGLYQRAYDIACEIQDENLKNIALAQIARY